MNLLDSSRNSAPKNYVVEMMRNSKLEDVSTHKKRKFHLPKINKNVLLYILFGFFVLVGVVTLSSDKFIVNADKLTPVNNPILGESAALSPSPLILKAKKNAVAAYVKGDNRILAMRKFLESKGSPLANYSDVIVKAADRNGLDYRLLVSISGIESGFCKATTVRLDSNLPTHNCWGWGKNGNRFAEFNTWQDAINTISAGISRVYGINAAPETMQNDYCHSCRGETVWQSTVRDYMNDISAIEKRLGK